MFNTHTNTTRTAPALAHSSSTPHSMSSSEGRGEERCEVRMRLEGAPWLSLRDRCGAERPLRRARRHGRAGRRASSWRSLSRLEVAMVFVLSILLAVVFRGGRQEPLLALAPPEAQTPAVAASLIE